MNWRGNGLNKTIIAPMIAVLCFVFTSISHINIDADIQEKLVTGVSTLVLAVVSIYGIVKNHKKVE
jgi:hypothetical protein